MNTDQSKQINTDTSNPPKLLYEDLTYKIRGAIFNVANKYGKGLREQIYQKALAEEFTKLGIKFKEQSRITIYSLETGKSLGYSTPDFLIEDVVIFEIKSTDYTPAKFTEQELSYLKASAYEVGMLANFSTPKLEIHRFIYTNDRKPQFIQNQIRVNP